VTGATFSVVTAAYQAAPTIAEAVESALAQTYRPLEIIVSDDGSTDDIERALSPYRSRVAVLTNDHRGPSAARNAALRAASGDFVAILDADDVYEPGRLAALAELTASRPELDILATDAVLEREGKDVGRFYREDFTFPEDNHRREILRRCFLCAPAIRRRRLEAIGGFDEALISAEDWDCWIRAILDGARAGLAAEPLLRYRLGEGSLTADRVRSLRARVTVMEKTAGRTDLSQHERRYLQRALAVRRWEAVAVEIAEGTALTDRRARRAAFAVAGRRDVPLRSRMKAAAYALSPTLTTQALRRRRAVRELNS
jgi:glycosyltransferase involved in cell wall biosynthesis